jgi:hypothetical protein
MAPLNTDTSVLAQAIGAEDYEEGTANEELEPGQGVVRGSGGFDAAGVDAKTKRIVREQRNPGGRGINDDESPLEKTFAVDANVETIGCQSHTKVRGLVAYADVDGDATDDTYQEGDDLGWNSNGYLEVTDGTPTETVATIAQDEDVTMSDGDPPTHVLVEFY